MSATQGRWTSVYVSAVTVVGAAAIVYSIVELLRHPVGSAWLVVGGLTLLSGATTLRMSSVPVSISIAETLTFAVLLMAGPAAATVTVALDSLSMSMALARRGIAARRFVFNLAAPPLAMWIAGRVLARLADMTTLAGDPAQFGPLLLPLGVAAGTYYLLNTFLIAVAIALEERRPVLTVWRQNFPHVWLSFFGGAYAAALLVVFLRELNIRVLLMMAPLPVVLYAALRVGLARLDDRVRHLQELNSQAEAIREQAALRQQAESALLERDELLHAVFANALDALVVLDDGRRFLDANPAARRLLGASEPDLLARRLDDYLDADAAGTMDGLWASFLAAGESRGEIRLVRHDGQPSVVEYTQTARVMPGRHLAVWRDVSGRRLLEEQLRQSQKMETVGRLAGGVAHDFNNILTAIMGYASLTLESVEGQVREDIQQVVLAGERAGALTRQLLAFSRKQVLQPVELDLNSVVGAMGRCCGGCWARTSNSKTRTTGSWRVKVDRGQLEQVLANLVVNARDAMPQRGIADRQHVDVGRSTPRCPPGVSPSSRPADTCSSSSATRGSGCTRTSARRSSSPSSRPRNSGRAPGWDSRPSTASCSRAAGTFPSRAHPAEARRSPSRCRPFSTRLRRTPRAIPLRAWRGGRRPSSWPRTTPRFGHSRGARSSVRAIACSRPQPAWKPSTCSKAGRPPLTCC